MPSRRVSDAFVPVYDRTLAARAQSAKGKEEGKQISLTDAGVTLPQEERSAADVHVPSRAQGQLQEQPSQPVQPHVTVPKLAGAEPVPQTDQPLITAQEYAQSMVGGRYHAGEGASRASDAVPPTPTGDRAEQERAEKTASAPCEETSSVHEAPPPREESAPIVPDWRIVGQVFHSYIIVEQQDKMLLIDQHAAHERILYEELRARLHEVEPTSQPLILPLEVMMMSDEVAAICEYQKELEAIGFSFTAKRNTLEVSALPVGVERDVAADMLCTIAERIRNNTGSARLTRDTIFERALYQGACKAAIKAGRSYAEGHLEWLVEQLMKLPDITVCPHGRPVAMQMSKQNIDHQFERS